MVRSRTRQGPEGAGSGRLCNCCGGSGVLRTDSAAYRTCLDCLGQGQRPLFDVVFALSDASQTDRCNLSASTSAAR